MFLFIAKTGTGEMKKKSVGNSEREKFVGRRGNIRKIENGKKQRFENKEKASWRKDKLRQWKK